MQDVFFSYSSADRERIAPIVAALEDHGFSVWWDTHLNAGETYDEVIEQRIESSRCVIVAWSESSRASRWVRSEANEGLERGALVPILIEPVKPPIAFRLIQAENFVNWNGDLDARNWQRLILQVDAVVASGQGRVADPAPDVEDPDEQILRPAAANEKGAIDTLQGSGLPVFSFVFSGLLAVLAGGLAKFGLSAAAFPAVFSNTLAISVAIAVMFAGLFSIADRDISARTKSLARRWLMPVKGGAKVRTGEAFNHLFEATFGQKHFSGKCMRRSAFASIWYFIVFVALSIVVFDTLREEVVGELASGSFMKGLEFWLFAFIALSVNIFGDYSSLFQTRLFLRFIARTPFLTPVIAVIDAVLSAAIYIGSIVIIIPLVLAFPWPGTEHLGANFFSRFAELFTEARDGSAELLEQMRSSFAKGDFDQLGQFVLIFFAPVLTTYLTSVWLWLVALFGPFARRMLWSPRTGMTGLGKSLKVQTRPFKALGRVIAIFILAIGVGLASLLEIAVSA